MELYPEEFGVIISDPKEAAKKASNFAGGINNTLPTVSEKEKGGIISGEKASIPNLIFISIDTLRADHLSCYGYKKLNTHNIDALAQKGTKFAQAYTSVPITLPSHSSMMTGLYPMHHGALDNLNYLDQNNITLAEILKDYGYTTAAFISGFPLIARFNFYQGFDYFNNERGKNIIIVAFPLRKYTKTWIIHFLSSFRLLSLVNLSRKAEEITKSAMDWLKNNHKEPFFLFLHFWDPHGPYRPPKKYLKPQYHNNASWFQFLKCFNPLENKYPYNGEIAYVDEEIGRIKHFLENSGISKNSIIVFISDHGEGLDEHNYKGHTDRVYEEQLHVPLLVIYPPLIPEGKVVKQPVDIVNIMPTILDMLKIPAPTALDGSSLMPLINEKATWNTTSIYATAWDIEEPPYYHLGAIIKDDWKLISHLQNKRGDQLYCLKDDPHELNNLAEKEKKIVAELKPLLLKWVWEIPKGAYIKNKLEDKETIERLKALGYIN
jgi:arylsulfatase A-like enzyme